MIIFYERYISNTGGPEQKQFINQRGQTLHAQLAKVVAEHLNAFFELRIRSGDYLFEGRTWMDPGPVVDLSPALAEWDRTPLRSRHPQVTLLDITGGVWKPKSPSRRR